MQCPCRKSALCGNGKPHAPKNPFSGTQIHTHTQKTYKETQTDTHKTCNMRLCSVCL